MPRPSNSTGPRSARKATPRSRAAKRTSEDAAAKPATETGRGRETMNKREQQDSAPHPAEVAKVLGEVAERSSSVLADFLKRHAGGKGVSFSDELGIAKAFMDMWAKLLANPMALAQAQMNMYLDYMRLWQSSWLQAARPAARAGRRAGARATTASRTRTGRTNFVFDYIKQSYLIAARHIHDVVSSVEGLPDESTKKVDFFTRQFVDALSPSNFVLTNPEVLRETVEVRRPEPGARACNNLLERPRARQRPAAHQDDRRRRPSRSARTSPPRRARSSTRTI